MTRIFQAIQPCNPIPMDIEMDTRFSFSISCPVPIDEVWGFIYDPNEGAGGTVSEDRTTPDHFLLLDIPAGEYDFQILGYSNGIVVAGLYGQASDLVDGQLLQLISGELQ